MSRKLQVTTRKTHRYLGLFIGVQLLFWTIGGIYFSWNNMKDVHGKTLLDKSEKTFRFSLNSSWIACLDSLEKKEGFRGQQVQGIVFGKDSLLRFSDGETTHLIAFSKGTYQLREQLKEEEVRFFVKSRLYRPLGIKSINFLKEEVPKHHEYRGKPLPVFVLQLDHETNTKVYVHPERAEITSVRNDNWRRFDFLWMLHVMDFETRDHITNWLLRIFSVLSLATVLSGFYLFYLSSPTIRRWKRK